MLYLDASALVKRYLREPGSDEVNSLFIRGDRLFTSILSYAEVQAAMGRKFHAREVTHTHFERAREKFLEDFVLVLNVLDMDVGTMAAIRTLVSQHPIRGADGVHLAAALWLRDMIRLVPSFAAGDESIEFITSDTDLAGYAEVSGLAVLRP